MSMSDRAGYYTVCQAGLQEPAPTPAAPTQEGPGALVSAQGVVQTLQTPQSKDSPSALQRVLGRFFDGSAVKAKADSAAEVAGKDSEGGSYLSRPPKTLFSAALAVWQAAGAPSEPDLSVKQDNGALSDLGAERDLTEDAQVPFEAVKVELPEPIAGADKVGMQRWIVTGGVKYAALVKGDKMIIMVNDGDPDYNFDRDAYRKMIAESKDVEIHGIGLGPQAQLVLDLFPPGRGWWLKDAADFAKNLRNILRKKLMGGR